MSSNSKPLKFIYYEKSREGGLHNAYAYGLTTVPKWKHDKEYQKYMALSKHTVVEFRRAKPRPALPGVDTKDLQRFMKDPAISPIYDMLMHAFSREEVLQIFDELENSWIFAWDRPFTVKDALENKLTDYFNLCKLENNDKGCFKTFWRFDCGLETVLTCIFGEEVIDLVPLKEIREEIEHSEPEKPKNKWEQ